MKVKDKDKIEEQLIDELKIMQHRITEPKEPAVACEKLEETLWRSAEQLQTLAETAPIIIIRSDLKTRVTYVNKKFEEVTGYSRDEVVGQSWTALGIVSVKNVRLFLKRTIEKLKGRPPSPMEVQLKRKDGEWIWVSGIGEIIREQGKPAGFQIIAQDITEHKRVEAKLKESERKYRNLYEEAPVAYFAIDANGYIQMANPHVTRLLGYTVDELIGRPLFDLCLNSATGKAKTEEILLKLKAKKEVSEEELEMLRADGNKVHVSLSMWPILDAKGKVTGGRTIAIDITEHKQAEEAFRQSRELFEKTFTSQRDAILILDMQSPPVIMNCNPAALDMFGYTRQEMVGKTTDFLYVDRAALQKYRELLYLAIEEHGFLHLPEFAMKRNDGTVFLTEQSIVPLKEQQERHIGWISVIGDITERQQAEEDIRKFKTIADSANYGISIVALDGQFLYLNEFFAKMHGYAPEELIGKHFSILYNEEQLRPLKKLRNEAIQTGTHFTEELWRRRKDGSLFPTLTTAKIIKDDKGKPLYISSTAFDITERKRMEEQLIVTDRLASVGELASGIAHELNNPLTSIIGFSDLLLQRDVPDDIKEDLRVINREAQRTADIVRSLLTFARKHDTATRLVDINSTIKMVLELRAYEQKVNGITVNTDFSPDLPEIMADGFQLQQVFLNIIINAEYFMTEAHGKGTLTITTARAGDIIRISFTDDGPGISEDNLGHIFDPFFTTKEVGKGTGLGLSISHGIITAHGGMIYAESEPVKGVTFIVALPVTTSQRKEQ